MSDKQEPVSSVMDEFSVNCQHIGGQACFVPTNAVKSFVDRCRSAKLVMAHGDVYQPKDGLTPVVAMVPDSIYKDVARIAAESNMSVPELVTHCLVATLGSENAVKALSDAITSKMDIPPDPGSLGELPEAGSDGSDFAKQDSDSSDDDILMSTERDEPPEPWAFKMDYGKVAEASDEPAGSSVLLPGVTVQDSDGTQHRDVQQVREVGSGSGIVRIQDTIQPLANAIDTIHSKREGPVEIMVSLGNPDRALLNIRYVQDGFDILDEFHGDLKSCIEQITSRLNRWSGVAFAPKLKSGQEADAKVQVQILEFDKSKGKYKAKIGEAEIWLDPEVVGQV